MVDYKDTVSRWIWRGLNSSLGEIDQRAYDDYNIYYRHYKDRIALSEEGAEYTILLMDIMGCNDWLEAFDAFMRYIETH